ncbi:hypothetical protein M422DRAFT_247304 [Sphaerobolus stellatus SS14]|nr:hypothetical protein M422DRAFT_247304 [Sphaerobolus stellatus SS14]
MAREMEEEVARAGPSNAVEEHLTPTFKLDRRTRNPKLMLDLKDQSLLRKLQLQPIEPFQTHHPYRLDPHNSTSYTSSTQDDGMRRGRHPSKVERCANVLSAKFRDKGKAKEEDIVAVVGDRDVVAKELHEKRRHLSPFTAAQDELA